MFLNEVQQACAAASARHEFRTLNLGDCFAYALATSEQVPILTLDADFLTTGHDVVHPSTSSQGR